jgi:effector-binding domain-containing protein
MKTLVIILGVLGILFLGSQIYLYMSSNTIEEYPYKVIKEYDDFEIRQYEASLFTSVTLKMGAYNKASRKGFSILGGYIFGANEKNESISMTSPVSMSLEDEMTMMFMVPKEFSTETLPKPENQNIKFIQMPQKKMAAITFSGWANDKKIEKYKAKLVSVLAENNIKHNNTFSVLGYNPPYEVLFRRNEIIVELE